MGLDFFEGEQFKTRFRKTGLVRPSFPLDRLFSRGLLESELEILLSGESLDLLSSQRANAAKPFYRGNNEGLNISWNYGSSNKDYLAVALFSYDDLSFENGHDSSYLEEYPLELRGHKYAEQPYVVRVNGSLELSKVHYILVRTTNNALTIYRQGLDTNPDVSLVSGPGSISQTIIFGERHFLEKDTLLEMSILDDVFTSGVDAVICEVLENIDITSQADCNYLMKQKRFNPKNKDNFSFENNLNTSLSHLCDWFTKYQIPFLGLGCFENGLREEVLNVMHEDKTVSFIGRGHIYELSSRFVNSSIYLPRD